MNDLIKNSKSVDYVKNRVKARRFKKEDAKEVRNLIVRNFLEINSRDYGLSAMETLAKVYDEEKVLNVASYAHMYVFEFEEKIVGTGSISSFWGSETEHTFVYFCSSGISWKRYWKQNYKYIGTG